MGPPARSADRSPILRLGVLLCFAGVGVVAAPYVLRPMGTPAVRIAVVTLGAAVTAAGGVLSLRVAAEARRAVAAGTEALVESRREAAALRDQVGALRSSIPEPPQGAEAILEELDRALRTSPSETEGLSALRRLLDAQRVALVRFEHSPGMGQYRSVEAADGEEIFDERHVPMAEFQHELLTRPEAFLIEDLEATDALPPVLSRLRGRGLRSVAGGALVAGGKTVGRLLVCRSGPSPRTAFDRQVAREAGKRFAARFDGAPKSPSVGLEDLEAAKAELGALTFAISHDLRAPLRAIQGFGEILAEDYADRLGAEGVAHAERIVAAAERLDSLLQDLHAYGRLSQAEIEPRATSLEDAVRAALEWLSEELRSTKAEIVVDEGLPEVRAHPSTLVTAISHLVGNALKFVERGTVPKVRIRGEARSDRTRLWVEDNGIGIAPEHHDRIFGVFERLHGIESYPGSGIGLAAVRRAAERMGGAAGVESEPGRGSRFWLELPSAGFRH